MIICMFDILCVTNRRLCREDFLVRIEKIAAARPAGVILREKDLTEDEYRELAAKVLQICEKHRTLCILHSFADAAAELKGKALHMPLPALRCLSASDRARFPILGASCHSTEDAAWAESLGCTYITAGHIFDTACKKGTAGRGLAFLQDLCERVSIPVYAIGGIAPENINAVRTAGARGACVMSGPMTWEDAGEGLGKLREMLSVDDFHRGTFSTSNIN